MASFYAVAQGRYGPAIYNTWDEGKAAVHGFPGCIFKKFGSREQAEAFIDASLAGPLSPIPSKEEVKSKPISEPEAAETRRVINVFIDGACHNNGKPSAKAGYACNFPDFPDYDRKRKLKGKVQTNNRAEFSALLLAHQQALHLLDEEGGPSRRDAFGTSDDDTIFHIYTDSQLLYKSVTVWMNGWKARNWTKKDGAEVKNSDLLEKIYSLTLPYKLMWIRAHTGGEDYFSVHNAKVDAMATEAASAPIGGGQR